MGMYEAPWGVPCYWATGLAWPGLACAECPINIPAHAAGHAMGLGEPYEAPRREASSWPTLPRCQQGVKYAISIP